jgi:hypothetical protein
VLRPWHLNLLARPQIVSGDSMAFNEWVADLLSELPFVGAEVPTPAELQGLLFDHAPDASRRTPIPLVRAGSSTLLSRTVFRLRSGRSGPPCCTTVGPG